MDDPNITMEEYIQLMADKARGRHQTFNWETATYNKYVSFKPTVSIYNEIKDDTDFHISFSNSEDEDYTFIYNKDSSSYKLIPVNDLKPEPTNEHVEINTESCSENIYVKPMDSVICINKDTTPIEFDENIETNHDTPDPPYNIRERHKKVNEKVYAAQVRCELCKGPHYTKDCPLTEEGKTLKEAYYKQFGAPYQPGG
ncbi:zf-CCHC domain-containing protein [Tanacetum coccineum]|uniref:Zf-CCHC domain-containing protein n=1 Tax=Tanacetum coccineum TaxID=301880 RepID=A0ABQ5HHL3_9ASTR